MPTANPKKQPPKEPVARYVNIDLSGGEDHMMEFLRDRLQTKSRVAVYRLALARLCMAERRAEAKEKKAMKQATGETK